MEINPGTIGAALWIQQREQERRDRLTQVALSQSAFETSVRQDLLRGELRAALAQIAERDEALTDAVQQLLELQCTGLGHPSGKHDEAGSPLSRCRRCHAMLDHSACCEDAYGAYAEGLANLEDGLAARAATCFTRALDRLAGAGSDTYDQLPNGYLVDPSARQVTPFSVTAARALALETLERFDDAAADWTWILTANPDDLAARRERARVLRGAGHNEKALADYDQVVEANPGDAATRLAHADVAFALHRYDMAAADFRVLASQAPSDDLRRTALIDAEIRLDALSPRDQWREILDLAAASSALGQLQPRSRRTIQQALWYGNASGEDHQRGGEHERAVDDLERVLAYKPDSPRTLFGRACSLAALGRHGEAMASLATAAEMDPSLKTEARNSADLQVLAADPDTALSFRQLLSVSIGERLFGFRSAAAEPKAAPPPLRPGYKRFDAWQLVCDRCGQHVAQPSREVPRAMVGKAHHCGGTLKVEKSWIDV
ncbi:MAG: tetratricopeptide repeat protein [Candidatus Limnocylindrales bacterium]|jgi:tetratricopeptide (TPR) repeat protein